MKMDQVSQQQQQFPTDWKAILDCPLCLQTLSSPIATPCGHTFCSNCLSQALATSSSCPLCRSPCYLQPNYSHGRKPVVLVEKLIELAFGRIPEESKVRKRDTGEFQLGLFFLDERSFCSVPNRVLKLRAFEPYVLLLVRRCAENGVRLGIQTTKQSKQGLIVRVDRLSPFPDRFHSHHLLVQCFIEGLYEVLREPVEEPHSGGLCYAKVREINSSKGAEDPEASILANRARDLFEHAVRSLPAPEASVVFEDVHTGTLRALPDDPVELSFFLIEALSFANDAEDRIMFEPDVRKRLQYCIDAMDRGADFKRIASRRLLSKTRESLDFSRNLLFASGLMIFFGVALGGFETLMSLPFRRS